MLFTELTPEDMLSAVEQLGPGCTGQFMALNSYENRVYLVHRVEAEPVVAKFYRPGRWSRETILQEHEFLFELEAEEIPAVTPLRFADGSSLGQIGSIWFAVFPRRRGRICDELDDERLAWMGRYLARIHNVGARHGAEHRLRLDPATYGSANLEFLLTTGFIPASHAERYREIVQLLLERMAPLFAGIEYIRLYGDCHLGNIIWEGEGPLFVDFDDMVVGPPIQDLWMLPGHVDREELDRQMDILMRSYELMREFDWSTLRLVEPLSVLRMINYSAWIARRWEDQVFQRVFPDFGTPGYWSDQIASLRARLDDINHRLTRI